MMNLTFKRKLSKSLRNRQVLLQYPRAISRSWEQFESVDLIFDGNCLVIKPIDLGSDNA